MLPDPASTALAGPASTALAGTASSGLAGRASTAPAGRASTALAGRDTHDPATTRKPIPTLVRNRRLRWLAALAITAVSALVVVRAVEGAALWDGLGELSRRPELLALFGGGYAAAFALRAFAWRTLLGRSGRDAGAGRLFAILHAALFANHALPVKAGEVLRPYLGARAGIPMTEAAVSTVVARVLDFAALLAIAAALFPLTAGSGQRGRGGAGRSGAAARDRHGGPALVPHNEPCLDSLRSAGPHVGARARLASLAAAPQGLARLRPHRAGLAAGVRRRLRGGAGARPRTHAPRRGGGHGVHDPLPGRAPHAGRLSGSTRRA